MKTEVSTTEVRHYVAAAARLDADAWEWLYRWVYPRLFAYARRRLPTDAAADDAVSETMARAIDKIGRFAWRRSGFEGWLFGILRNVVLESYRREGRSAPFADVPEPSSFAPAGEMGRNPADILDDVVTADLVRAAFADLTADDREVLELRVIARLSSRETAAILGKKPGAVRMAQARAVERLRDAMEKVSYD